MISQSTIQHACHAGAAIRLTQLMIVAMLSALGLLYPALHVDPQALVGPLCWSIVGLFLWSVWSRALSFVRTMRGRMTISTSFSELFTSSPEKR